MWAWHGTVSRTKYLVVGVTLFAVKHLIDRIVATQVFGLPWGLFNYWIIGEATPLDSTPHGHLHFYGTLIVIALPFIWIGLVLTLGRLRDIGWPLWLVIIFFLPFVNILFFALLSAIPSGQSKAAEWRVFGLTPVIGKFIPRGAVGSAVVGVLFTTVLSVGVALLSIYGLSSYGWGIFVGLPFFLGLSSVLVYGFHQERSPGKCLLVSLLSVGFAGAALVGLAFEGVICVAMAAPLGAVVALFGGTIGYFIQRRRPRDTGNNVRAFTVVLFMLPLLMGAEAGVSREPALREVSTTVEIDASPQEVWSNLVSFAELSAPDELLFRSGIAYPLRAEIDGQGVGAIRYCVFSTGAFVEPIQVWDEPTLLRFGVTSQPPVMNEWTPFQSVRPPHLDGYLRSQKGQFHLTALANGRTRLVGTTWYENKFWPSAYWGVWSDHIIHRIHMRVLTHIKNTTEQAKERR